MGLSVLPADGKEENTSKAMRLTSRVTVVKIFFYLQDIYMARAAQPLGMIDCASRTPHTCKAVLLLSQVVAGVVFRVGPVRGEIKI